LIYCKPFAKAQVLRVRPKAMTVSVIIAGSFHLFFGHGAGSEVMQRIAAPMIGGMITARFYRCSSFQWRIDLCARGRVKYVALLQSRCAAAARMRPADQFE